MVQFFQIVFILYFKFTLFRNKGGFFIKYICLFKILVIHLIKLKANIMEVIQKIYYKGCLVAENEANGWSKEAIERLMKFYVNDDDTLNMYMRHFRQKYSIYKRLARIEGGNRKHQLI